MPVRKFITADNVLEVSRTARPHGVLGWTLTIEDLIILYAQNSSDWTGSLYRLTANAARRIAHEINVAQPWGAYQQQVEIVDGELLPPSNPKAVAMRAKLAVAK